MDNEQLNRYSRHILLPEMGVEGQEKLLAAKVLLVGAGGLGCPAALYLAAAGVGRIGIIDFDKVDASNLQRQVLYSTAVVLAQFMVACAFAVRTMRVTFDQIPQRYEQVALTLGCNRQQAFWRVVLPQARGGVLAAGTLAWARALGEFGPILVFAGATRQKTEVLPTSAFLELQAGRTEGMLAVSLIMIATAALVFVVARTFGMKRIFS